MTYSTIVLMLPSRKRIANGWLPRFVKSAEATATVPERLRMLVLVDADDAETLEYLHQYKGRMAVRIVINSSPSEGPHLAQFFNDLYDAASREWIVSMLGDDMEFITPGWDSMVLEAINRDKGMALVYGDDDYVQHERMAVHFFTTKDLVDRTKLPFMCERWRANIIDYIWTEVARGLGVLRYLPHLHIRHWHSGAAPDETYRRMDPVRQFASGKHKAEIDQYIAKAIGNARAS